MFISSRKTVLQIGVGKQSGFTPLCCSGPPAGSETSSWFYEIVAVSPKTLWQTWTGTFSCSLKSKSTGYHLKMISSTILLMIIKFAETQTAGTDSSQGHEGNTSWAAFSKRSIWHFIKRVILNILIIGWIINRVKYCINHSCNSRSLF